VPGIPTRDRVQTPHNGVDDKWKSVEARGRHSLIRRNLREFPYRIYFYVTGPGAGGSAIVEHPTYGS